MILCVAESYEKSNLDLIKDIVLINKQEEALNLQLLASALLISIFFPLRSDYLIILRIIGYPVS